MTRIRVMVIMVVVLMAGWIAVRPGGGANKLATMQLRRDLVAQVQAAGLQVEASGWQVTHHGGNGNYCHRVAWVDLMGPVTENELSEVIGREGVWVESKVEGSRTRVTWTQMVSISEAWGHLACT